MYGSIFFQKWFADIILILNKTSLNHIFPNQFPNEGTVGTSSVQTIVQLMKVDWHIHVQMNPTITAKGLV